VTAAVLRGEAPDLIEMECAIEVVLALDIDLREVAAPIADSPRGRSRGC
jgi:hypothetical protein